MSIILELVSNLMVGAGAVGGTLFLKKKLKKISESCPFGTLPWSIYQKSSSGNRGFRCPKCININKNTVQPPICTCDEYHREHFHYKCGDCGYTNILRTADDK
jgi:hypothetical protein